MISSSQRISKICSDIPAFSSAKVSTFCGQKWSIVNSVSMWEATLKPSRFLLVNLANLHKLYWEIVQTVWIPIEKTFF